jgi:5-methylcytosine-specific restriction endonuclease McrA
MVRGTRDPRSTGQYKNARLAALRRDGYTCMYCGDEATQTDHIVSLKDGGDPCSLDNLISSCARCNNRKGSRSQAVFLASISTPPASPSKISPRQSSRVPAGPCVGQTKQS